MLDKTIFGGSWESVVSNITIKLDLQLSWVATTETTLAQMSICLTINYPGPRIWITEYSLYSGGQR